jgi:hypothetical protein
MGEEKEAVRLKEAKAAFMIMRKLRATPKLTGTSLMFYAECAR